MATDAIAPALRAIGNCNGCFGNPEQWQLFWDQATRV